jgi:hypothetical protein
MNCVKCDIKSKDKTRMCWTKHQMCVKCAVKHHPEDYDNTRMTRYGDGPRERPKRYFVCTECKGICSALMYFKNRTSVNTKNYICAPCRRLYITNDRLTVVSHF